MADNKRIEKLNNNTLVIVENIGRGSAGYNLNNGSFNIRRDWGMPGVKMEIPFSELKIALTELGIRRQFEEYNTELKRYEVSELLIKDSKVREELQLVKLDKYCLDNDGIIEAIESTNLTVFEDIVKNCSDSVLDSMISKIMKIDKPDMNKAKILESYSGQKVVAFMSKNTKKEENVNAESSSKETKGRTAKK